MTVYIDEYGHEHHVIDILGQGGQGMVCRTREEDVVVKLEVDVNGQPLAQTPEKQQQYLALRLLPLPTGLHVTLPLAVLKDKAGYAMELMGDMRSFGDAFDMPSEWYDMCNGKAEPKASGECNEWLKNMFEGEGAQCAALFTAYQQTGGERRRLRAYLKAACIMSELHNAGLVYCDFSKNNAFISKDMEFVNVWFIDADNLDFQAVTRKQAFGTPGVWAPELSLGKGGNTFAADCFAFASTFFQQMTWLHPFEGRQYDEALDEADSRDAIEAQRDQGEFPWLLDEDDDSNATVEGTEVQLEFMPPVLQPLFSRTFGAEGCFKSMKRPTMAEWVVAIADALDGVLHCPYCGMDWHFPYEEWEPGEEVPACKWCDAKIPLLVLRSSFGHSDAGREFWHAVFGLLEPAVIPLRAVHGFFVHEAASEAFELRFDGRKLSLRQSIGADFVCEFADVATKRVKSRGFVTDKEQFSIYCIDNNFHTKTLIEGWVCR